MSEIEGQLDIFDALEGVTVHCFFSRWCGRTVNNSDPEVASREMEAHYAAKHYGKHLEIVYRDRDKGWS